jgi:predicted outer membrane repeat protein
LNVNSSAKKDGGAIFNAGNLTVTNGNFTSNSASVVGVNHQLFLL